MPPKKKMPAKPTVKPGVKLSPALMAKLAKGKKMMPA